jgi:SAM-dependent methyltransferase
MDKRPIYNDGELYDLQNAHDRYDVDFFREIARRHGGPVLELACGTGVLGIPIALDGHEVTGLDLSEGMLRQARKKAAGLGNIGFLQGNMCDFHLGRRFKTIFVGFNSICHLFGYGEIKGMLDCVREHLADDGVFVLDCFIPAIGYLSRDKEKHYPVMDESGLKITETNEYDPISQVNRIKWYYEYRGERWTEDLDMRMFYPEELQNYLLANGFAINERYGNHDFGDFGGKNRFQIYLCRKA